MSLPKIIETSLGYKFEWLSELINIEVTRLKQHNDGRLLGELSISTTLPGYEPHLHQASFNFTASSTREKLSKSMQVICPECEWHDILEQLCVYTLRKYRAGTPVKSLWTSSEINPPSYLINPFIIRNYPTIIFGDPSSGKSTLAQLFITALTLPWEENQLGLNLTSEVNECIIFDYETDEDTIAWQIGCIQRGMGLPEFGFHYRRCFLPLADDVEEAMKAIEETGAKVIIVDSLGPACGGELNEAKPALAYANALRKLNRTSITLAHTSKNANGQGKSVYGSIFFQALARSVWEIKKIQENDSDEIEVGLFHRKPPPFSKLQKPVGFKFQFDGEKTIIKNQDPRGVGEFLKSMGTTSQILELLKDGLLTKDEVSQELEITPDNAKVALNRLKNKNLVVKVGDKFGLTKRT
jgi:hypothetical protein